MEGSKSIRAETRAGRTGGARPAMIPALQPARATQSQASLLPETIAELHEAGFFRVLQPKRWGGYEMDLGTFYDIEMALGEGDMSSGWTYGTLGAVSWFSV